MPEKRFSLRRTASSRSSKSQPWRWRTKFIALPRGKMSTCTFVLFDTRKKGHVWPVHPQGRPGYAGWNDPRWGENEEMHLQPLHHAAMQGHIDPVIKKARGWSWQESACRQRTNAATLGSSIRGHLDIVRFLVTVGANKDQLTTDDGSTPLHWPVQYGDLDIIHFLVEVGASRNQQRSPGAFTPLHLAAQEGYLDVVQLLVESGCDIDRATQSGATALDVASECGHSKVVGFLASLGVKELPRNFARKIHWDIGTTSGWHNRRKRLLDSVALASPHGKSFWHPHSNRFSSYFFLLNWTGNFKGHRQFLDTPMSTTQQNIAPAGASLNLC